jgi:hypothetical protein
VAEASSRAKEAGAVDLRVTIDREVNEVEIEGRTMFIEARITATASGGPGWRTETGRCLRPAARGSVPDDETKPTGEDCPADRQARRCRFTLDLGPPAP